MRSITIAAFVALVALISTARAAAPPYRLDVNGKCHDSTGSFVDTTLCTPPPKICRDPKTGTMAACSTKQPQGLVECIKGYHVCQGTGAFSDQSRCCSPNQQCQRIAGGVPDCE